ncbi:MAG: tetratricopeptide repeat protein [Acidobacteria bacterium]|nr:tetratricopeptide repeat protein [Acidobacteriota bacterium]
MRSLLFKTSVVFALLLSFKTLSTAQSPTPAASYEQALSLIQQKQFEPGIALLRKILEQTPNDIRAYNLLGIALTVSGKIEEANTHFEKAIALNPRFYPALKNLAINEMKLNRTEEAKAHFLHVLQLGSDDPVVHLALGEIHFQGKQFVEAVKHYDQSRDLPARDPRTLLNYATSCLEAHQPEKAVGVLEKLPPEADALIHFEAGVIFVRLEKYERAAGQFELARKGYPDPYEVTFNLTLAYIKSRNYTTAIRTAQGFISQGNKRADFYNLLAQAHEGNGQTVEAYNALRTATQLDPKDENNYLDLATLCVDHANYDLGLEIVGIGINNIPQSDRLYFQRGTLLAMKGQSAQAAADFETASKLSPQKNLPYVARGLVLLELNQTTKAIELLRQRVAASPNDYLAQYVLGEAINRSGPAAGSAEENEAIQALEKSVLVNPNFPASHATLGKLLLRRGEVDRAITELEKALELDSNESSSLYQLAVAYRKKGNQQRARELFAKVDQLKTESREQFMKRTLLRLVREGSQ